MKNLETIINYQEEQREFWKNVWASVSSSNNCSNKEVPTRWADKALQDFNDRFQKNVDYMIYISERDQEIKDLEYEINSLKDIIQNHKKTIKELQDDLFNCEQQLNREI